MCHKFILYHDYESERLKAVALENEEKIMALKKGIFYFICAFLALLVWLVFLYKIGKRNKRHETKKRSKNYMKKTNLKHHELMRLWKFKQV